MSATRQIWKFELTTGEQVIAMPAGADVLAVNEQGGRIFMWAICTPSHPACQRTFYVAGTGWNLPDSINYLGSAFVGTFVWHAFERV